jgi:putative FmdB family regulatory protein
VPTYEYVCTECGTPLEVVQTFTDDPLVECPTCGGRLRKVFSAVGVVFKGSGFYRNDSRSEKSSTVAAAKSPGDSKSSGDGGSSTESKPSAAKDATSGSGSKDGSSSTKSDSSKPSAPSSSSSSASSSGSPSKTTAPKT